MKTVKLGLQVYAVREAFAEDPANTLKEIKKMGYECVEFTDIQNDERGVQYFVDALKDAGLVCTSIIVGLNDVMPDKIEKSVEVYKALGAKTVVIGSVNFKSIKENHENTRIELARLCYAYNALKAKGFNVMYHGHDGDVTNKYRGTAVYDYFFENTPDDFYMCIDTGNIWMGGGDPFALLEKFPGRQPLAHIKGAGKEKGYTTPVWEAELDFDKLLPMFVENGGTDTFIIEFGARSDYDPMERAKLSYDWLLEKAKKHGLK